MQRPAHIKDKNVLAYIDYLEKTLRIYQDSSYAPTYITYKKIVDSINEQIRGIEINIGSEDSDKSFKKITAATDQLANYTKMLDSLRAKMNPADIEAANLEARKIVKEDGVEQFLNENKL